MDLLIAIDPERASYGRKVNRQRGYHVPDRRIPRSVKGWQRVLNEIRAAFEHAERQMVLDFEGYAIKRYTNAAMFPMHKTWHWALTWHIQRYRIVRAAAQAAFPSHTWGAL